jgi:hypothetical protein
MRSVALIITAMAFVEIDITVIILYALQNCDVPGINHYCNGI